MATDLPPPSPDCLEAREAFTRALEDPDAEKEVMVHAAGCLECMDAFLELKDTVKRLQQAASALPESGTFTAQVFAGIDRETETRKRRAQLVLAGVAGVLIGLGLTVLLVLTTGFRTPDRSAPAGGEPGLSWPEGDGSLETGKPAFPGRREDEGSGETLPRPTRNTEGEDGETGDKGDPEKKISSDPLEPILEAYRTLTKERPLGPGGGKTRRFRNVRSWMEKVRRLSQKDLDRLISRLEEGPPKDFRSGRRFHEEVLKRLKLFRDKGFLPFDPPPPRKRKKAEGN